MKKLKIKKDTVIRTALLIVALVNMFLNAAGKNTLPFTSDEVSEVISALFTFAASMAAWWKNNSFTQSAIQADTYLDNLKNEREEG